MYEKRYFLQTEYDRETGAVQAKVMECPAPYAHPVCREVFSHEWRAERRINELVKAAYARGERVVHGNGDDPRTWK